MRISSLVLAGLLVFLPRPGLAVAPCDATDADCLVRQSLKLSYELEAARKREEHLRQATAEAQTQAALEKKRADKAERNHVDPAPIAILCAGVGIILGILISKE